MSFTFEKKYKNYKYPHLKLYTNMIFDEKQLIQFINKNKKVILKHKNNSIINITSNLKNI